MRDAPHTDKHYCEHCRYYHDHALGSGDCHRFPPLLNGHEGAGERNHWKHPKVHQHDWCGEFQDRHPDA